MLHSDRWSKISLILLGGPILVMMLGLILGASARSVLADPGTLYVALDGDCGGSAPNCYSTIQVAVDAAQPGDEIRVSAGTYSQVNTYGGGGQAQVVYISKTVTIQGGYTTTNWTVPDPLAHVTTLDASGKGRVMVISGDIVPTIRGLHITGGEVGGEGTALVSVAGGGVYIVSATATLEENVIFDNAALFGGGIYLFRSGSSLGNNIITGNTGRVFGGGVYIDRSNAILRDNTIVENRALESPSTVVFGLGGGVMVDSSDVLLEGNTISRNYAQSSGGGVYLGDSTGTLADNDISSNTAGKGGGVLVNGSPILLMENTINSNIGSDGGGVYVQDSEATVRDNAILRNTALSGGGLYLESSNARIWSNLIQRNRALNGGGLFLTKSPAQLEGNEVLRNYGQFYGGGIALYERSDATLVNDVVAENYAGNVGGSLHILGTSPRLLHTTLVRNTSGSAGGGIYVVAEEFLPGHGGITCTVMLTNVIIAQQRVGIRVDEGNRVEVNGVLWFENEANTAGPGTIVVGHALTGDPTFVNPTADDYHIQITSAALDTGVDSGVIRDIDRHPRPYGDGYDLGADEWNRFYLYCPTVLRRHRFQ